MPNHSTDIPTPATHKAKRVAAFCPWTPLNGTADRVADLHFFQHRRIEQPAHEQGVQ